MSQYKVKQSDQETARPVCIYRHIKNMCGSEI